MDGQICCMSKMSFILSKSSVQVLLQTRIQGQRSVGGMSSQNPPRRQNWRSQKIGKRSLQKKPSLVVSKLTFSTEYMNLKIASRIRTSETWRRAHDISTCAARYASYHGWLVSFSCSASPLSDWGNRETSGAFRAVGSVRASRLYILHLTHVSPAV
jgi:hypothetical protein